MAKPVISPSVKQKPLFMMMLDGCACGNWRSLCNHGTDTYALWGAINTAEARRS